MQKPWHWLRCAPAPGAGCRREAPCRAQRLKSWKPSTSALTEAESPWEASAYVLSRLKIVIIIMFCTSAKEPGIWEAEPPMGLPDGRGTRTLPSGCPAGRNVVSKSSEPPSGPDLRKEEEGMTLCQKHHSNHLTGTEFNLDFQ